MSETLKTYTQFPSSGGEAKQIVMLLHGLGANGQDLIGLGQYWKNILPDAVFVSPDAPFPCDMAPVGYQWFSLQDRSPDVILAGVKTAQPILDAYIDGILSQYGLSEDKLALVGFSQGTMMSLYAAPRRQSKIAGILGYSGALIGGEELAGEGIQNPPTHLIHGEADSVVPVAAWQQAKAILESAGFDVTGHTTPGLEHGIDDRGVESGAQFLSQIFA